MCIRDRRFGNVPECVSNQLFDLVALPACDQLQQFVARSFELTLVCSEQPGEDLGETHSGERLATEEPCLVEGLAEGERRRLRNDGLVEIEESCLLHHCRVYRHLSLIHISEPTR